MSGLERRIARLEALPSKSREPLVVTVRHRIVRATPDGPASVGTVTRTFRDGELVAEEREGL